jgi:hypothetical protein
VAPPDITVTADTAVAPVESTPLQTLPPQIPVFDVRTREISGSVLAPVKTVEDLSIEPAVVFQAVALNANGTAPNLNCNSSSAMGQSTDTGSLSQSYLYNCSNK